MTIFYMFLGGFPDVTKNKHTFKKWITFLRLQNQECYIVIHPIKDIRSYETKKYIKYLNEKVVRKNVKFRICKYHTPTKWGTSLLVKATLFMLKHCHDVAKRRNGQNYYFLVDSKTYPLWDKDIVEKQLIDFDKNMILQNSQWFGLTDKFVDRLTSLFNIDKHNNIVHNTHYSNKLEILLRKDRQNTWDSKNSIGEFSPNYFYRQFLENNDDLDDQHKHDIKNCIISVCIWNQFNHNKEGNFPQQYFYRNKWFVFDNVTGDDKRVLDEHFFQRIHQLFYNEEHLSSDIKEKHEPFPPNIFSTDNKLDESVFILHQMKENWNDEKINTFFDVINKCRVTNWNQFENNVSDYLSKVKGTSPMYTDWAHSQPTFDNLLRQNSYEGIESDKQKLNEILKNCEQKNDGNELKKVMDTMFELIKRIYKPFFYHPLEYTNNSKTLNDCPIYQEPPDTCLKRFMNIITKFPTDNIYINFRNLMMRNKSESHLITYTLMYIFHTFNMTMKGLPLTNEIVQIAKRRNFIFIRKVIDIDIDIVENYNMVDEVIVTDDEDYMGVKDYMDIKSNVKMNMLSSSIRHSLSPRKKCGIKSCGSPHKRHRVRRSNRSVKRSPVRLSIKRVNRSPVRRSRKRVNRSPVRRSRKKVNRSPVRRSRKRVNRSPVRRTRNSKV